MSNTKNVIRVLNKTGWRRKKSIGGHLQFVHTELKGKVTVPSSKKDLAKKTFNSILVQMGITKEDFLKFL